MEDNKFCSHSIDLIIKEINAYYNFCNSLENKLFLDTDNKGKYIELYIIPKIWLNVWKKHSKYKNFENYLKKNNKKEIDKDVFYDLFEDNQPIYLESLSNCDKYIKEKNENEYDKISIHNLININQISILDKTCWDLFSFVDRNSEVKCHGLYKKHKLIVGIENNCYYIMDFSNNKKKQFKLIFDENNRRNSLIIEEIINTYNLDNFFNSAKHNFKNDSKEHIILYKDQKFYFEDISYISKDSENDINNINNINNKSKSKNNKNEKQRKEKKPKPNKKYINNNNPSLVGLTNIGATCYMNAVLQSFSNIRDLTNYLFKPEVIQKIEENKDTKPLAFEYLQLIKHLWLLDKNNIENYGENISFSPTQFKKVIGELNNLFIKNEANDSKDLIIFMEEELHKELNFLLENKITNDNNLFYINQYNEKEVSSNYYRFFIENYKSIISHLFYGTQKAITTCVTCGIKTFNYQIFSNLIFPLEAVREFKGYKNFGNNTTYVSFQDCLEHFQQNNYFTGMNRISCNHCRNLSDAFYINKIELAPNILIIILNRGKGLEFNVNLDITEYINIKNYVGNSESPFDFELIGVIMHYGDSSQSGHFAAICKNKNDNQWYKYNDSIVNRTNFKEIKTIGIPYVLFYQTK